MHAPLPINATISQTNEVPIARVVSTRNTLLIAGSTLRGEASMLKRFALLCSTVLALMSLSATASDIPLFNNGTFFSIVGTTAMPTVPVPLMVGFDSPVFVDSFISITSSDIFVLRATASGATVLAGQSSAVVLIDAFAIGTSTLTASYAANTSSIQVSVVSSVPAPAAVWLFTAGLGLLVPIVRRRTQRQV